MTDMSSSPGVVIEDDPYLRAAIHHLKQICPEIDDTEPPTRRRLSISSESGRRSTDSRGSDSQVTRRRAVNNTDEVNITGMVNSYFYAVSNRDSITAATISSLSGFPNYQLYYPHGQARHMPTADSAIMQFIQSVRETLPHIRLLRHDSMRGIVINDDRAAGAQIGVYTGRLKPKIATDSGLYSMETTLHIQPNKGGPSQQSEVIIDALDFSNHAEALDDMVFGPNSHINMMCFLNHGCPGSDNVEIRYQNITAKSSHKTYTLGVPIIVSKRALKAGEQLYCDYGPGYGSRDPKNIMVEGYSAATPCMCPLHKLLPEYRNQFPWYLPVATSAKKTTAHVRTTLSPDAQQQIRDETLAQHAQMLSESSTWEKRLLDFYSRR